VISVAGVMPFAPTFDTVGVMTRDAATLGRVAEILLGVDIPSSPQVNRVHIVREAFELCEPDARDALAGPLKTLRNLFGDRVCETSIHEIDGEPANNGLIAWYDSIYAILQCTEIWSSLGTWISETKPEFGPMTAGNFELARTMNRGEIQAAVERRETICHRLQSFLEAGDLLCIPTTPTPAPLMGTVGLRSQDASNYYLPALSLTSLSGVGRLPQVTIPLAECSGIPIGLSLLSRHRNDAFLLAAARLISETCS
jgi:amidase